MSMINNLNIDNRLIEYRYEINKYLLIENKVMPSDLKGYMGRNQLNGSSRTSQQMRRQGSFDPDRYQGERNIGDRYVTTQPYQQTNLGAGSKIYNPPLGSGGGYGGNPDPSFGGQKIGYGPSGGGSYPTQYIQMKYPRSKQECVTQMDEILKVLEQNDQQMITMVNTHNRGLLQKLRNDYDSLIQQIVNQVRKQLIENRDRVLKEVTDRRNAELAQVKPIRRNMEKLRNQILGLKDGLYRDNQYRNYIAKVVVRDFEIELGQIQQDINRLRFPGVNLRLDDRYYNCFKNDTNKLILVTDDLYTRMNSDSISPQSPNYPQDYSELNPHTNRDQIKRSQGTKFT